MISYAQNFEDVLLWRALQHVERGFYVDVGAADPDEFSVTRWFYDQGWSGVNIEPNPAFHARLVARRPRDRNLACAAGARTERLPLLIVGDTGMSTLSDAQAAALAASGHLVTSRVEVPVEPLANLLEPDVERQIHFLKIDAEGFERAVLEGADFRRQRPWIVVIEATLPNSPVENAQLWRDVIEAADYRDVWFDGLNRWFVAAERIELAARIAKPPNVFDDFRPAALVRAEEGRQLASLRVNSERAAADSLQADWLARLQATAAEAQAAVLHAKADADSRIAVLQAELQALRASTSWRVTRPLRGLRQAWVRWRATADAAPSAALARAGMVPALGVGTAGASPTRDLRQFARMFRRGGV